MDSGSDPVPADELTVKITDTDFTREDNTVRFTRTDNNVPSNVFNLFDYITEDTEDIETFVKRCAFTISIKLPEKTTTKHIVSVTHTGMRTVRSSLQENDTVPPREVTVVSAPKSNADAGTLTISLAPSISEAN